MQVRVTNSALVINGDAQDNSVSLLVGDGNLVIRGLDDTTINGGSEDFVVSNGSLVFDGRTVVRLGEGNDTFAIGDELTIHRRLVVEDYFGDDSIAVGGCRIDGGIEIWSHEGDDSVRFNATIIHGQTNIYTGAGDDLIVLDDVQTSAFFRVSAGPGDDGLETNGNQFNARFVTRLGFGDDTANFEGDDVAGAWLVRTKGGDDLVQATGMTVEGWTLLRSTTGDDNFNLTGTNTLSGVVVARLGIGEDNLALSEETTTSRGVIRRGVEGDAVDESLITDRIADSTSGLSARADALRESLDGQLSLTVESPAATTESNGVLLTAQQDLTWTGTSHAGAKITIDVDGDGTFDDGTATADSGGHFTLAATFLSDVDSPDTQTVTLKSSYGGSETTKQLLVDLVVGTVVRFETSLGSFDVELLNDDAPATVANFLNYLTRYTDSIIHRSEETAGGVSFVVQGGGYVVQSGDVVPISTDAPVANEFDADNSNVRGTLAMALPSNDTDGGTSQWFINMADNSDLDSGLYTVFGRVLGNGMDVVDDIHAWTSYNLIGPTGESALANVPLQNYTPFTETISGTASVASGDTTVTGVGTSFLTELIVGEAVRIGEVEGVVASIIDDTTFTLAVAADSPQSAATINTNALPAEENFVTFSSISTLALS